MASHGSISCEQWRAAGIDLLNQQGLVVAIHGVEDIEDALLAKFEATGIGGCVQAIATPASLALGALPVSADRMPATTR